MFRIGREIQFLPYAGFFTQFIGTLCDIKNPKSEFSQDNIVPTLRTPYMVIVYRWS